jgi:chromosome segregation ATPase
MKQSALLVFAFCFAPAFSVTPIQKVIQMLEDMHAKGVAEKEAEAAAHTEYMQFCKDTAWDKSTSIKTAKAAIEELTADIGKGGADILVATKEIAALDADITQWTKDVKRETDMRDEAHKVFAATHEDYSDAIDAVERALQTLKGGASAALTQTSLLQLSSMGRLSAKDKKRIMSFLQTSAPRNALLQDAMEIESGEDQPQAKEVAYESSSGGVIDMVEKLGEKFTEERTALETQESEDKFNYDMMMQDLNSQIEKAGEEREGKIGMKAQTENDKAENEGDLSDTKSTLAEDEKFLSDLTAECESKAMEIENNQKVRQEELDAITKATEIMKSDAVSLIQSSPAMTSLVQLRSTASSMSAAQQAVVVFLEDKAERMNSRILQLLAAKAAADPFKKVIKMIKDMITKLVEEANEEAEHKGFCDQELGQNKATRDSKTEEVELLKARSEELAADISKLANQIKALSEAVVAIDSAVTKATSDRTEEKERNTKTIEDAKAGKEAVGAALKVLKDFYDKAATATMLTQIQANNKAPYTGMGGGGVLGMLEVCQSDFARLESETTSAEATATREYDEFMADSSADKATKEKDGKDKKSTMSSKEYELSGTKKDLEGVQDELDAAMAYYEKLKPSCVDAGESYEERVARRKQEIESLKEALKILNGQSI